MQHQVCGWTNSKQKQSDDVTNTVLVRACKKLTGVGGLVKYCF